MNPSFTRAGASSFRRRRRFRFKPSRTELAFVRTLEDFCETALSEGSLRETSRGLEWYVGDLQNSPGDSCHVNLVTGVFHDFTTGEKGGPRKLFAVIFGIDPKDREAVLGGMDAWVEKGELPDGNDLGEPPEKIIRRKPPRRIASRPTNSAAEAAKWDAVVAENVAHLSEIAALLAEYRGLSVGVFEWLLGAGYIAMSDGPWFSRKTRRIFYDPRIVFPVAWKTEEGVDFYGVHARWSSSSSSGREGKGGWVYVPEHIPALPYVIGDLPSAELVAVGESSWDVISYIDLYELYTWSPEEDGRWAVVATRGATNVRNLAPAFESINPSAHITLLRQNDDADGLFLKAIPAEIRARARHIIPPDGDDYAKDLNDWLRRDGPEAVRRVLASAASYS
jgi:hypothetical protein